MAGLRIRKPGSGLVQLSSSDVAYQLVTTGSALLTSTGENRPQPVVGASVTVSGTNPILAWRSATGAAVTVRGVVASGGNLTYHFRCTSGTPVGLIYWVFDVATNAGNQITGPRMQAWTEQGVKTFDSRAFAMKLSATGSGPNVAVIQSMFAYRLTNEHTRQYSNNINGPWAVASEGSNFAFYLNRGRGFHTAARFNADGSITTGLQQFETFTHGQPTNSDITGEQGGGQSNHTFIDISGLPRASMPSAGSIAVGASHTLREVAVGGAGSVHSITPAVTITPSGGTAPYSYLWERASGSTLVGSYGPQNTTTFQTQANIPPGEAEAIWRCRVSDSAGRVGYSPDVVFRHTVVAVDLVPNPLTLSTINFATNAHHEATSDVTDITGISQPITLRVERYGYTGNIDGALVYVYSGPTAGQWGPWTHVGSFDPRGTGLSYVDFTAQPNSRLHYVIDQFTTSGRRNYAFDLVVWNLSNPGGPAQLSNRRVNLTVDADNNYYPVDYTIDPVSVGPQSFVTNDQYGGVYSPSIPLRGYNQNITLRITISNRSSNMADGTLYFVQAENHGNLSYRREMKFNSGTLVNDVVVPPNFNAMFYFDGITDSGRRTADFDVTITNLSASGAVVASFHCSGVVDNDNNFNISGPPVISVDNSIVYKQDFVFSGSYYGVTSDPGATNVSVSGQGPFTFNWTRIQSLGQNWQVIGTTQPQFYTEGTTSFSNYAQYRLTVTDALGRLSNELYFDVYLNAGDQL